MADKKIITDELLKLQTEKVLQVIADLTYDLVPYDDTEISDILEITDEQAMQLTKILNDQVVANNKLWSSSKTDAEIKNALIESNKYSDELIGKISSISLEYVTTLPTSDIKSNVIYILQGTPNTLNVYNESASSFVSVGSLDFDFSTLYNKTEVDNLLADKADDNTVVHADDVVQDLTTTSGTTVLSSAGLQTELDKKVDKTSIATSISNTSTDDEVASALATYKALDDKNIYHFSSPTEGDANKLVIKGKSAHYQISNAVMSSGTITNLPADLGVGGLLISHGLATVHQFFLTHNNRVYKRYGYYNGTDTEVTWVGTWQKVIFENDFNETVNGNGGIRIEIPENVDMNDYTTAGFYKILGGAVAKTIANLPIQNACLINIYGNSSSATGWMTQEIIADNAITNNRYIRYKVQNNANWSPWEKLCTTSVPDVEKVTNSFIDTNVSGSVAYVVKNGICTVKFWPIRRTTAGMGKKLLDNLPLPKGGDIGTSLNEANGDGSVTAFSYVNYDGNLFVHFYKDNSEAFGTFSYPVA